MHPAYKHALLAGSISLALVPAPASAQSAQSWIDWGQKLNMPVNACPTAQVPPAQQATNPWFGFNGTLPTDFKCQAMGPFKSLNTPHGPWFMQNVLNLRPTSCKNSQFCRVHVVRICSLNALHGPNPKGPFGGDVGGKGCEGLWGEEVPSSVP